LRLGIVRTVFAGRTNVGKSTLINALFGEVILPEKLRTSTVVPTWIGCNGYDSNIRVYHGNPEYQACDYTPKQFRQQYCYAKDYLSEFSREQFMPVRWTCINRKHRLGEQGVVVIDTPGTGICLVDEEITHEVIRAEADILVCLSIKN